MVRIALAGGNGNVGREVLDGLLTKGTHELVVFTRGNVPDPGVHRVVTIRVDYNDKMTLVGQLQGVDTVLSFIVSHLDADATAQKNLVDASI